MSIKTTKEVACDGMHPYESKTLANEVCRRSARSKGTAPEVYKCPYCHSWHIGRPLRDRLGKQQKHQQRRV